MIRPCSLRAISSTRPEIVSGMLRISLPGAVMPKRYPSSPFNAEHNHIDWLSNRYLSVAQINRQEICHASCSRCHIAAARACSVQLRLQQHTINHQILIFQADLSQFLMSAATSCSVEFAVVQPEPGGYVQDRTKPLPHEHTAHAAFQPGHSAKTGSTIWITFNEATPAPGS